MHGPRHDKTQQYCYSLHRILTILERSACPRPNVAKDDMVCMANAMIKLDNIVTVFISQAMIKLEHFDTSRSCVTLCLYIGAVLIAKIDIKFISFISQSKVLLTLLLASQDLTIEKTLTKHN